MSQGRAPTVNPLNSTALKWSSDGELSALDQQRILQLLCRVDPVAESLMGTLEASNPADSYQPDPQS
jgi:hypothetical protein